MDAAYWADNLRKPVRFAAVVETLLSEGISHFVEVSAHPVLASPVEDLRVDAKVHGVVVGTLTRGESEMSSMLEALGGLHTHGVEVDWPRILSGGRRVELPTYAWQRQRYWVESTVSYARTGETTDRVEPEDRTPPSSLTTRGEDLRDASSEQRIAKMETLVADELKAFLPAGAAAIDPDAGFQTLGLESIGAVRLRVQLARALGVELPSTVAFSHPTIRQLARYLSSLLDGAAPAPSRRVAPAPTTKRASNESLAIIGMACRTAGAENVDALWDLVVRGKDAITKVPRDRWDADALYSADHTVPGTSYVRSGGFLSGDVFMFDAEFFGISPKEALELDPEHRLLLELAWEALEDAGINPRRLRNERVGIFAGLGPGDYADLLGEGGAYTMTGNLPSMALGRIAFTLGLRGPAIAVETACSSSLVAVHLAAESLRRGECDLALVGGARLNLTPKTFAWYSRQGAGMAPDGRPKAFDAAADGMGRGEGGGMIVMKRLNHARRDHDRILSLVRGTAINQDGPSSGLTAPNGAAQTEVIHDALSRAGVAPRQVGFVEAHGTGTVLGDPIEVIALDEALRPGRSSDQRYFITSVKSNVGHLELAAGVISVIKAVLTLRNGVVPPQALFSGTGNPNIPWDSVLATVPTRLEPFPAAEGARIAGVSGFGVSGTNAHVILSDEHVTATSPSSSERKSELVVLSARAPAALDEMVTRLRVHLESAPDPSLGDVAFSTATTRAHERHRMAIATRSRDELCSALRELERGEIPRGATRGRAGVAKPKVVFVFPGQGAQWVGMGRELLEDEPVFRAAMEECDRAIHVETGWSVLEELRRPRESTRLGEVDVLQPALFAIGVSLSALWRSWGIEPDEVIGQSQGEIAAAHVAGALSLADAAAIICRRSRLFRSLDAREGAMAMVRLSEEQAKEAISGYEAEIGLAVLLSPRATVLAGTRTAIDAVLSDVQARGVHCTRLTWANLGAHSPMVDSLEPALRSALEGGTSRAPRIPMRSTVTGGFVAEGELDASYWWANMRQTVRLTDAVEGAFAERARVFVEVSPHPGLLPTLEERRLEHAVDGAIVASLSRGRPERAAMLEGLGELYVQGCEVDWNGVFPHGGRRVSLPTYPWQRKRFAPSETTLGQSRSAVRRYEVNLDRRTLVVEGPAERLMSAPFDAAAIVQALHEHATEALGKAPAGLRKLAFEPNEPKSSSLVQICAVLDEEDGAGMTFSIKEAGSKWSLVARGTAFAKPTGEPARALEKPATVPIEPKRPSSGQLLRQVIAAVAAEAKTPDGWPATLAVEALGEIRLPAVPADVDELLVAASWASNAITANARGAAGSGIVIDDLRMAPSPAAWCMEIAWQPQSGASKGMATTPERFVIVDDDSDLPKAFAALLRSRDLAAEVVSPAALGEVKADGSIAVVHMAGISARGRECLIGAKFEDTVDRTIGCALDVVHDWNRRGVRGQIWFVTNGAQVTSPGAPSDGVAQSLLWGFGRTLALEHPEFWGGAIDIEGGAEDLAILADVITGKRTSEDFIAIRNGAVLVPRIVAAASPARTVRVRRDATYLVTGGDPAMRGEFARWAAAQGAHHIVSADDNLSTEADVRALVERAEHDRPPIRGVIHLAIAAADFAAVLQLSTSSLRTTVVRGTQTAVLLDRVLGERGLEFFWSFSSISAVWGAPTLAAAGAQTAFLDALAANQRARGIAGQAIAFGPWRDAGISKELLDVARKTGLDAMAPSAALAAIGLVLGRASQALVAPVDWDLLRPILEMKRPCWLVATISESADNASAANGAKERTIQQLEMLTPQERRPWMRLQLQEFLAHILGYASAAEIDPRRGFFEMGMDSLAAMTFRRRVERWCGMTLPATLAMDAPDVEQVIDVICTHSPEAKALLEIPNQMDIELSEMSEDELATMLAAELSGSTSAENADG
jgi:acyl transferase domain-containing protein